LFSLAQVAGMAHLENDLLLVTIECLAVRIITSVGNGISFVRSCLNIPITFIATVNALVQGNTCH
jgi:hypothetical protein